MTDLLLELFSEEIPARMQEEAAGNLARLVKNYIGEFEGEIVCYSSPRRIAIQIKNLPINQPDINTELKGPKIGAPEQAIQGFLKKSGAKLEQLQQQDGVYVAKIHQKGRPTLELAKDAIEAVLKTFPWPKSMRWGNGDVTWVRPLHTILCIFDGKVVPVEFGGIKANNNTYGHRFLAPKAITVKNAADYESALQKAHVIADRDKRKEKIKTDAENLAAKNGLTLRTDTGLLEEVTGLVEWPTVLMGAIDAKFMDLPKEVLVSEMRTHQKYFALEKKDGALSDKFLITANSDKGEKNIIAGNERVLRARFSDARFFWDQDRKKPLAEWAQALKHVTFHAKLGSIADKVERIKSLALQLAPYIPSPVGGGLGWGHESRDRASNAPLPASPLMGEEIARAAQLCKADLVTGMVGEFPELQGVMGRYYALAQKEDAAVADAIRDHYKPQGPADSVPSAPVSVCVALADKLDTLVSMFAIGEKPTGSKDPFALRRAALGVIRIILENGIRLPLSLVIPAKAGIQRAASAAQKEKDLYRAHGALLDSRFRGNDNELLAFFHDRLIVQLKDSGIRHDVIKAVVANGDDDLVRIKKRAEAVQDLLESEDGKNLLAAYKRATNIVEAEEKKDKRSYKLEPDIHLLQLDEEKHLHKVLCNLLPAIDLAIQEESFTDLIEMAASMRKSTDAFFDKVLVNDPDSAIRANRLCLLAQFRTALDKIANFALIEG